MKCFLAGTFLTIIQAHADSCLTGECPSDDTALLQKSLYTPQDQAQADGQHPPQVQADGQHPPQSQAVGKHPPQAQSAGQHPPEQHPPKIGTFNEEYGAVNGNVYGGVKHGKYENDVNWNVLTTWKKPKCREVCRNRYNSYCYPIKNTGYLGTPCGVLNPGPHNNYGCFFNDPTETCALCTAAQGYCCLYRDIPFCPYSEGSVQQLKSEQTVQVGKYNSEYGAMQGAIAGGVEQGIIQNDVNWYEMSAHHKPDCSRVCRRQSNDYCYPIKFDGWYGTPCGLLNPTPPGGRRRRNQGCFYNPPTQTCALCNTQSQSGYCCPTKDIPICA